MSKKAPHFTDTIDAIQRIYALRLVGKRTQIRVRWDCSGTTAPFQVVSYSVEGDSGFVADVGYREGAAAGGYVPPAAEEGPYQG